MLAVALRRGCMMCCAAASYKKSYGAGRVMPGRRAVRRGGHGPRRVQLARRVVVCPGGRAQLVTTTSHGPQRAVEELLELGELVVDVDVALTAQPVGLGMRSVYEASGLGVGSL